MGEAIAFALGVLRRAVKVTRAAAECVGDLPGEAAVRWWLRRNVLTEPAPDGGRMVRLLGLVRCVGGRWTAPPEVLEDAEYAVRRLAFGMARPGGRWKVCGSLLFVIGWGEPRVVHLRDRMWDGLDAEMGPADVLFGPDGEVRLEDWPEGNEGPAEEGNPNETERSN